ncbi:BamA/TamA family outer membrane protein [Croceivirga thetidis]|uniref:BamA/TamA family outer membrane protein n=1 Tax=Croceivirga thetidis TaxID=2721623 RepID=A0ABX1GL37_9FLAO|nr:BamA/TamA family outer membrane protein [Croceivirga thetidis]NKI30363.1 BamA/TamA family outer membrane protein [Croceivirga thetidis]
MKLLLGCRQVSPKIGILFLVLFLASCNAVKKVGEDEFLLTKNIIEADGKKITDETIKGLILQNPNTSILGYPLRLNLYNLAKKNPDSLYQNWLNKKEKRQQRLNSFLSKKQVDRLGESFVVRGYSNLFERIGEPPSIIDTVKTRKSTERLQSYFGSKGYFNSTSNFKIVSEERKKKAQIIYEVNRGKPYFIDSLQYKIPSTDLDSLYQLHKNESLVKNGAQFDLENFNAERGRLTNIFRNSGVYNFQESSISFNILRDTSLVADDQLLEVELDIKNLPKGDGNPDGVDYKIHTFKEINIFADYSFNSQTDSLFSLDFKGYKIWYDKELKYQPKALTDAVFFEKDSVYSDINRKRTLGQITNLNTFKYPNIEFIADSTNAELISNIYLAPRPKYSFDINFDISRSNLQQIGVGLGTSVITRNVFGGSETLSLSARGSVGILDDPVSDETFTSEIGGDINLTFPRIWLPFNTEQIIPYYMTPQTRFSVGTNFQQNVGLDRQSLNSILSYNWTPSSFVRNTFELLNIEFVRNTNTDAFFNVYDATYSILNGIADGFEDIPEFADFYDENVDPSIDDDDLQDLIVPNGANDFIGAVTEPGFDITAEDLSTVRSIEERRDRLTEDNLIFSSSFTFQKNNREGINDNQFYSFRGRFESAGNLLSLAENFIPFEQRDGSGLVFGVPYTQYVKTEFDFIKHWDFRNTKVLAFHSFIGLAIPYGNSESVPFVRSYFGGGSNDNRAWNPYSLGPGRTDNQNDFNEANLKIALNLEYRFPLLGDFKGAFFADAGNIWNVFDNVEDPEATFNGFSSLEDIALGTGFGLRYDFTYFVIRLDTGFKTFNPAKEGSRRWFTDFNLSDAVLNIGINYPF